MEFTVFIKWDRHGFQLPDSIVAETPMEAATKRVSWLSKPFNYQAVLVVRHDQLHTGPYHVYQIEREVALSPLNVETDLSR